MPARSCAVALLGVAATIAGLHRSAAQPPAPPEPSIAVRKIRPGVDPAHLVIHDGKLYTSGFHAGRVTALDLLTGKKLGDTQLDGYERVIEGGVDGKKVPTKVINHYCGGSIVRAGGKLFAEQGFSDLLLVIDPDSMRVIKRLPLGDGLLAATPDGKTVVCARSLKDEFHLIDAGSYRHTTVPYPEGGTGISAVAVSPDGQFVVLGIQRGGQPPGGKAVIDKGNSFLAVYDLAQKKYAATLYMASSDTQSVSEFVDALAYSPDGKTLYAGMFQATTGVRVVDPAGWRVLGDIRFEPNARNKHFPYTDPLGLAFHRGWLFVANRGNQEVVVIDPATSKPAARLQFAGGRHDFHRVLTEGDRVYLADQEAVYELDGWALARRLAARAEKTGHPPLELVLKVRRE
jgi:DNA-binding beta-propeller fold protein YncE